MAQATLSAAIGDIHLVRPYMARRVVAPHTAPQSLAVGGDVLIAPQVAEGGGPHSFF